MSGVVLLLSAKEFFTLSVNDSIILFEVALLVSVFERAGL